MKICIVEYNDWHDELIPSYVDLCLKLGFDVDVYMTKANINKAVLYMIDDPKLHINQISHQKNTPFIRQLERIFYKYIVGIKTYSGNLDNVLKKQKEYDLIIFNSMEPLHVLYKIKDFSSKVISVLHNGDLGKYHPEYFKYIESNNVNLFVLSNYIKNYLFPQPCNTFYPVFLGNKIYSSEINSRIIKFAIQGNFDSQRRNYFSLIDAAHELIRGGISNFEFHFIGNTKVSLAILFKEIVAKNKLQKHFIFYDKILPYDQYYEAIGTCSFILPLLDNSNLAYLPYLEYKCSSSINTAIGLNVLPVVPNYVAQKYEIETFAVDYSVSLFSGLRKAILLDTNEKKKLLVNLQTIKTKMLEHNKRVLVNILKDTKC